MKNSPALDAFGASLAHTGHRRSGTYQGQDKAPAAALSAAANADEKRGDKTAAAKKTSALSEAQLALGRKDASVASARKAVSLDSSEAVAIPACTRPDCGRPP